MNESPQDTFGLTDADFLRMIGCRIRTGQIGSDLQTLRAKYAERLKRIAAGMVQPPIDARELSEEEVAALKDKPPEKAVAGLPALELPALPDLASVEQRERWAKGYGSRHRANSP